MLFCGESGNKMKKYHHRIAAAFCMLCIAVCLAGCIHYVPREETSESQTQTEETTAEPFQTTAPQVGTGEKPNEPYPNEAENGYSKRY